MIAAACITPRAAEWLRAARAPRVLSVFDRACNLADEPGWVLTLLAGGLKLNPFALSLHTQSPAPFRAVASDSRIAITPSLLSVGPLRLSLDTACPWNPAPDWPAIRLRLLEWRPKLRDLSAWAAQAAPGHSLLDLWEDEPAVAQHAALLARLRQPAAELVRGLASASLDLACAGARGLAGAGGGLTPAGDDFIVGALLAAWAGLLGPSAVEAAGPVAEAAAGRTTTLSAAYLRAAAQGECLERWHDFLAGLCDNGGPGLRLAAGELLSVGHTSGADALAGFLAAEFLPIQVG